LIKQVQERQSWWLDNIFLTTTDAVKLLDDQLHS